MSMQASERQKELLRLFLNADYLTTNDIANKLKISDKTIRNEIKQLNQICPGMIGVTKGKGFFASDKEQMQVTLSTETTKQENRRLLIFKHILTHGTSDYYQLADQYFISESTLDHDIQELNRMLQEHYDTLIVRKKNQLILDCNEELRRKIYTFFLMHEIENYNFDLANYNHYFKYANTVELKEFVLKFFKKYQIRFNDIEIVSFIIHIAIAIDRVKNHNSLSSFADIDILQEDEIYQEFCSNLESHYELELNAVERNYIASLLSSRISTKFLQEFRNQDLMNFIDTTLQEIASYYQINLLDDTGLKHNLLIHLSALNVRVTQKKLLNNPLIREIKDNFPLIYDIGVFISMKIQDQFNFILTEEEIGFIALHLMCSVEKMKQEQYAIAIVDPLGNRDVQYYEERLQQCFPNMRMEVACFSIFDKEDIRRFAPNFIIATTFLQDTLDIPVVLCTPLFTKDDSKKIKQIMHLLQTTKGKNQILLSQFSGDLFFPNLELENKDEILAALCGVLVEKGYCDAHYLDLILQRESLAPTCFGNLFAIPHPTKKEALKSGIAIAILKNAVDWGGQKVKVVFLFSLTKQNDNLMKLYEVIVNLLDDVDKVKRLAKQTEFHAFIKEFFT